ncbi:FecCD family ABC transporter permease [Myxacorys almedinensis]|uniref:Iron chelate uptake ABC transporter family permease subunit n=1 Tax=Myxacorys almedinensis A TaxID=2690445 RepID=A0A8J8CJ90_9CYAN|nr:iron ABC transporter permease [Myxacorys almedinensis]NDJ17361.1 iron chelate uptake ABC transporter family permease subunit [Myxacorys almedinensis A]
MINSERPPKDLTQPRLSPLIGLGLGAIVLLICLIFSVTLGAKDIPLPTILESFTRFDNSVDHLVIQTVRIPRSVLAIVVGAALAVSGALMQGLTRNPLAETGILGIGAGGALAVVATQFLFGSASLTAYASAAFLGAGAAAVAVYGLGTLGRGGATPLNLTVAGAALTAFISSITTAILIVSQRTFEEIRFWLAGSLAGRDFSLLLQVLPFMGMGLLIAFLLGRQITTMSLGEDIATSLGQRTLWIKILTATSVVLLAGGAVAIAGPIGFVGLVVPHVVRFYIKTDYRWILPYSALLGAILLLLSDIAARVVLKPQEIPVGVMTAIVGAPFFVYLAKSKVKK